MNYNVGICQKIYEKYGVNNIIINHCQGVGNIGFELGEQILSKNPKIQINPDRIRIAGYLHDIGKVEEGMHEFNTIKILQNEGLYEIAKISMHGLVYEYYLSKGEDKPEYLPQTLENKLLVLADSYYNQKQQRVSIDERFEDIIERYGDDKEFIKIVNLAKPRILNLEKEIKSLLT